MSKLRPVLAQMEQSGQKVVVHRGRPTHRGRQWLAGYYAGQGRDKQEGNRQRIGNVCNDILRAAKP